MPEIQVIAQNADQLMAKLRVLVVGHTFELIEEKNNIPQFGKTLKGFAVQRGDVTELIKDGIILTFTDNLDNFVLFYLAVTSSTRVSVEFNGDSFVTTHVGSATIRRRFTRK